MPRTTIVLDSLEAVAVKTLRSSGDLVRDRLSDIESHISQLQGQGRALLKELHDHTVETFAVINRNHGVEIPAPRVQFGEEDGRTTMFWDDEEDEEEKEGEVIKLPEAEPEPVAQ